MCADGASRETLSVAAFRRSAAARGGVARALARDPSILLADEPTGNLDLANGEAVMELLSELHKNGSTICKVTHDTRYAASADRTIHLFDGKVVHESDANGLRLTLYSPILVAFPSVKMLFSHQ